MPRVSRSAGDRGRRRSASGTWSPIRTTCRAGGRGRCGSRTCARPSGERGQWTTVLETERGTGVRADFRCTGVDRGERYAWEQQIEGTPFERVLRAARLEIELAARRERDRGHPDQRARRCAGSRGSGSPMMRGRRARAARRGARPGSSGRWSDERRARAGAVRSGGAGATRRSARRSAERGAGDAARPSSARPSPRSAVELERGGAARSRGRCPTAIADAVGAAAVLDRPRAARAPRRRAQLPGPGPAAHRRRSSDAPDAVVMPGERGAGRSACSRSARARASPWCRSAAAPASSAGSSRSRATHERRDRARPAPDARGRGRPRLADGDARARACAAPRPRRRCARTGCTIGHFPQSFEYATIGGFAATRSAGQASAGYGRFDELVTSLAMATPVGELRTLATPHTAAGPSLRELVARLRGRARGDHRGHGAGPPGARERAATRPGSPPTSPPGASSCARWPRRTRSPTSPGSPTRPRPGSRSGWRRRRAPSGRCSTPTCACAAARGGCLVICGWEGERESVDRRRALSARLLRRGGAVALGEAPGRAWERGRYDGPYLRDELLDLGYLVETLETSHTWSRLGELYRAVGGALDARAARPGHARDRHVPPLARLPRRRLALLHLRRPRRAAARRSSSGAR